MRPRSFAAFLVACAVFVHAGAAARSVDSAATCDTLAGLPLDSDRPASVSAVATIAKARIAEAVTACEAASALPGAHRRMHVQHGRALQRAERYEDAASAYERAAEAGSSSGMVALATLYAEGLGLPQDWTRARRWFETAAVAGDPAAMSSLGSVYGGGLGVPVDMAAARQWYERSARLGFPEAMFQLGLLTQDGDIGPRNDLAAKAWFEKAAAKDHAAALFTLGEYAEAGRAGVPDENAARRYYRKAAALGDEDAMAALQRLR